MKIYTFAQLEYKSKLERKIAEWVSLKGIYYLHL